MYSLGVITASLQEIRDRYVCNSCKKSFFYLASLKKHVQQMHPEEFARAMGKSALICSVAKHQPICASGSISSVSSV